MHLGGAHVKALRRPAELHQSVSRRAVTVTVQRGREHLRGHPAEGRVAVVTVVPFADISLSHRFQADESENINQHGDLESEAGGKGQPRQQVAVHGQLARERLHETGQRWPPRVEQGAGQHLRHPAAAAVLQHPVDGQRPVEGSFDELDGRLDEQRCQQRRNRRGAAWQHVRVQEHQEVAPRLLLSPPQRPALAREPMSVCLVGKMEDPRAGLCSRCRRTVVRATIDDEHLVEETGGDQGFDQGSHDPRNGALLVQRGHDHRDHPVALERNEVPDGQGRPGRATTPPPCPRRCQGISHLTTISALLASDGMSGEGQVDVDAAARAVTDLLVALGQDPTSEHLTRTPLRVARAFEELLTPSGVDPTTFPNDEGYDELVLVRDIPFHSLCEHHLLPFVGKAHLAYLPKDRILGLSKLARVVEHFSRSLQVQERMTQQIANWLEEQLSPRGVGVVLEAEHMCMRLRGVRTPGTMTVTSALRGALRNDARTRGEFLDLVR